MSTTTTEPTSLDLALFGAQVMGWPILQESADDDWPDDIAFLGICDNGELVAFPARVDSLSLSSPFNGHWGNGIKWNPAEDANQANMVAEKARNRDLFIEAWTGAARTASWRVNVNETDRGIFVQADEDTYPRALMLALYRAYQEMQKTV